MSEPLRFATSHSHNLFAEGGMTGCVTAWDSVITRRKV